MNIGTITPAFIVLIIIISLWELAWKGVALWHAARSNQIRWYIAIIIFNTIGILPIVYLMFFKPNTTCVCTTRPTHVQRDIVSKLGTEQKTNVNVVENLAPVRKGRVQKRKTVKKTKK